MRPSSSMFLSPVTMTLLSGMMILVVITLAMTAIMRDQTGHSIASVSMAFRSELNQSPRAFEVIPIIAPERDVFPMPREARKQLAIPIREIQASGDRTSEFRNLLSELQRVAGSASASQPFSEISMDFHSVDAGRLADVFAQACDLVRAAARMPSAHLLHFEIRLWATSPTTTAWTNSAQAARVLRRDLQTSLSTTSSSPVVISSSAALWPHADRMRPDLTIIVRQAPANHSDVSFPDRDRRN